MSLGVLDRLHPETAMSSIETAGELHILKSGYSGISLLVSS